MQAEPATSPSRETKPGNGRLPADWHLAGFDLQPRTRLVFGNDSIERVGPLAREFGPDNITANTVAPGAIDTIRDWTQYVHQPRERIAQEIPLGRFGKVEEVAAACELLCSERGGFISGQVLHVNGGHYMY